MRRRSVLAALATSMAVPGWTRAGAPARVVSASAAMTEIVFALQAQHLLVGVDSTSQYPPAAQGLPRVGYFRQLSAEGVLSLMPDSLLVTQDAGPTVVLNQLRTAGVRVEAVPVTHDWQELQRKIDACERATGQGAHTLRDELAQQWAQVQAARSLALSGLRVLFVLAHGGSPQVAGRRTAASAMVRLAGAQPALYSHEGYRPMTPESLVVARPDVILITQQGLQAVGGEARWWDRPGMSLTPAHARRALVAMEASWLLGFGPRLPAAVSHLRQALEAST